MAKSFDELRDKLTPEEKARSEERYQELCKIDNLRSECHMMLDEIYTDVEEQILLRETKAILDMCDDDFIQRYHEQLIQRIKEI